MASATDLQGILKGVLKKRFFRYGMPFLLFVVGGSFGLKEFSKLRYQFSKQSAMNPEVAEKYGVQMKKTGEVTLESEFEKIKKLDIDNWTNIRGPRPMGE
ncbi:cytochrome c oxidase assembly protein COX16 homolog, mitochondrial [Zootermopsis nevadensis]|uniref:Cytochrome c oxidase assembly protein COX16 homolog, mitochondrial n=1 Tax=Zootermopsis nevadensis TaxID=136037 RepID=A0A067RPV2_ZOONE|nr:cytochrome c oxidase assembly protein COX16 homolog, mitochondrial [Zootermopsis nevadensis]KDR21754.1 Cytochrome c oxidase assembly protein COX16-like protein, mitochondrial [Zootermopsis nevadensis]